MRTPNYYAAPGFDRAGLRRRDAEWLRRAAADPTSIFVPVWRSQNLVVEIEGGEPRAAVLTVEALGAVYGGLGAEIVEERLSAGELVLLGILGKRPHFAVDVSPLEAPLEMLRSPALEAAGIAAAATGIDVRFADLRQLGARLERHEGALLA